MTGASPGRRAPATASLFAGLTAAAFVLILLVLAARPAAAAGGATVAGTVRSSSGTTLPGIRVDVFNATYGNLLATTTSNGAGSYSITGLPSYAVVVRYSDPAATWTTQYFDRVTTFASATRLTVPAGTTATADGALVPRAGIVTGFVGDGSGPLAGIAVTVLDPATSTTVAATTTGASGTYKLTGVPAGSYLVRYVDPGGTYGTEFFPSAPTAGSATLVTLTGSAGAVADAELAPTGSVSGRLRVGRLALPGVWAVLATPQPLTIAAASLTDANGNYTIDHVTAGTYKLVFIDTTWTAGSSTGYRPIVFPDLDGGDPATQLAAIAAGADQVVPGGGSLTGRDGALRGADCSPAVDGHPTTVTGSTWAGKKLMGCNLTGSTLASASLVGTDLTGATLKSATVTNANLTGATLRGIATSNLTGTPSALPSPWKAIGGLLLGPEADLKDTTLASASLTGVDLTGALVDGAGWSSLSGTPTALPTGYWIQRNYLLGPQVRLSGALLGSLDLHGRDLHGASLTSSLFTSSNLSGADLTGANLTSSGFGSTNLTGTVFAGAELYGSTGGSITGTPASLPSSWTLQRGWLLGPGARTNNANLSGLDLSGLDLHDMVLTWANLTDTSFVGTNLRRANLAWATVTNADFTGADLYGISSGVFGTAAALPTGFHQVGSAILGPGTSNNGASLVGADLSGFDLTGARLTNVDATGANVTGTNFTDADLSGTTFGAVDFAGTNLTRTKIVGTGLDGATLTTANLTRVKGAFSGTAAALPAGWRQAAKYGGGGAYLMGPSADLTDASVNPQDLTGVDLSGALLVRTRLGGSTLTGAVLEGADLTGAGLANVTSGGITGTPAALPTGWVLRGGYLLGQQANLSGVDLTGVDFAGANLTLTNLSGADLSGVDLTGCNLTSVTAIGTAFVGTNLTNATLTSAVLTDADFTGAGLQNAVLTSATVTNTGFGTAALTGVRSGSVVGTPATLPLGWAVRNTYLVGPGASLVGAPLNGQDFTGVSLAGANLTSANLTSALVPNVDLTGANLTSTKITSVDLRTATLTGVRSGGTNTTSAQLPTGWAASGGYLLGRGVDLHGLNLTSVNATGVDFTDADLSGTNLTNATLVSSVLEGTDLTGATLTGVTSRAITGTPAALPASWVLRGGALLGPTAKLTNVDLAGVDLTGVDLGSATLTHIASGGITGTPTALPAGWLLDAGYLFGPGANLAGADLSGFDLRGANLKAADLVGANLDGALLDGANLNAAVLDGASLVGTSAVGADVSWARMHDATIDGLDLSGADLHSLQTGGLTGSPAALPVAWVTRGGFLIGPGGDYAYADLSGLDLSGLDLTGAEFSWAKLIGTDLTGATLTGAAIQSTDLTGAALTGVRSGGMYGPPKAPLPTGWTFAYTWGFGYLLGPGADLTGADLRYLNVTSLDVTGASMAGVDLRWATVPQAVFTGVDLSTADLRFSTIRFLLSPDQPSALPTDYFTISGYLLGPSVIQPHLALAEQDYSYRNLSGADLSYGYLDGTGVGVNLENANLTGNNIYLQSMAGADLRGAVLTNAVLATQDLTGADLTGSIGVPTLNQTPTFSNTICPTGVNSDANGGTCVGQGW